MKIERFEDMEIWKEARELCRIVFLITSRGAFQKEFRFRDQIRASSGSIMDNIAQGFERGGNKELIQFLFIAKGSCAETRSQAYRSLDFDFITKAEHEQLTEHTKILSKKIFSLIQYLKNSELKGPKHH